jgi:hypothetical protein
MKRLAVATAVLAVALSACGGGGGGGRPSSDDIAKALKDQDNPAGATFGGADLSDDVVDCVAKAFHDSDLSDEALQAIVDGDEDFEGNKEDQKIVDDKDFTADMGKCVTG